MTGSEGQAILDGAGRGTPGLFNLEAARLRDVADARSGEPMLDWLDRRLLDVYQRDFPVCEMPFAEIASRFHCHAGEVLRRFAALERRGVVNRIGPVFAPGLAGASTVAAMAVPPARLESVARWVNRYRSVSHNYEREHEFNLWFVLAAPNAGALYETLADIRRRTGLDVLDLRLERAYHAGPEASFRPPPPSGRGPESTRVRSPASGPRLDAADRRLVGAVQDGLPLTPRPYATVADRIGLSEAQVMERIRRLLHDGVIVRIGVVVSHHELGYRANAMVVFDVPRARVDMIGERLARIAPVTECCQRFRRLPVWPYNLHCTLRGRDRTEVTGWADGLLPDVVGDLPRKVLFSRRRFRPCGTWHAPDQVSFPCERPAPWLHRGY